MQTHFACSQRSILRFVFARSESTETAVLVFFLCRCSGCHFRLARSWSLPPATMTLIRGTNVNDDSRGRAIEDRSRGARIRSELRSDRARMPRISTDLLTSRVARGRDEEWTWEKGLINSQYLKDILSLRRREEVVRTLSSISGRDRAPPLIIFVLTEIGSFLYWPLSSSSPSSSSSSVDRIIYPISAICYPFLAAAFPSERDPDLEIVFRPYARHVINH